MFLDCEDLGQLSECEVKLSYNCLKRRDCFFHFAIVLSFRPLDFRYLQKLEAL